MRIAGDPQRGRAAVLAAYEAGYTLFDHADIYGGGACEELFGQILREVSGMREEIVLQGKVGIRHGPGRYDFSAEYLLQAVDGSLRRLGVERLDSLLLHRIDLLADVQVVAEVFDQLHEQGKVARFGLSNASPSQVRMFAEHCRQPLIANQIEINLDRIDAVTDGSLDLCQEFGIQPQAWCPIAGLGYKAWGGHASPAQWRLVQGELQRQAEKYQLDSVAVNLAWLLRHPAGIVPLIGSTTPERIRNALLALGVDYEHSDWYHLWEARHGHPVS